MKLKFNVTGMTCAACSARVEKVTNAVPGVEKAEVNLLAGTMQVEAASENVVPTIVKAVQDAGYNAALPGEKKAEKAHNGRTASARQRTPACTSARQAREFPTGRGCSSAGGKSS